MHNSLTFWDDNSWMKLMTDFKRTDIILLITEYKGKTQSRNHICEPLSNWMKAFL